MEGGACVPLELFGSISSSLVVSHFYRAKRTQTSTHEHAVVLQLQSWRVGAIGILAAVMHRRAPVPKRRLASAGTAKIQTAARVFVRGSFLAWHSLVVWRRGIRQAPGVGVRTHRLRGAVLCGASKRLHSTRPDSSKRPEKPNRWFF